MGPYKYKDATLGNLAEDPAGVERPWLLHLNIEKQSGEPVECTASLLNK